MSHPLAVSRETEEKLSLYTKELLKWNEKINLIGRSTSLNIIDRHIVDCSQLQSLLNKSDKILDIGSGAGMPGIVLSILGFDVTLVEKDFKKYQFLCKIRNMLKLQARILNLRLEKNMHIGDFNLITCRAFANLADILSLTKNYFENNAKYVLPKGKTYQEEIDLAKSSCDFQYSLVDSKTNKDSKIIILKKT